MLNKYTYSVQLLALTAVPNSIIMQKLRKLSATAQHCHSALPSAVRHSYAVCVKICVCVCS